MKLHVFNVLILLFICVAFPLDKIIFEDGTEEVVQILEQTDTQLTYKKDGVKHVKAKAIIQSIETDFDLDKYYRAGNKLTDANKKLKYMELSVKYFPNEKYNKTALVRSYVLTRQIRKAERLYNKLNMGYLSFDELRHYVENERTYNELRIFTQDGLSIEDYGKAKKLNISDAREYRTYIENEAQNNLKKNQDSVEVAVPIPKQNLEGYKPMRVRLKAGLGTSVLGGSIGNPSIASKDAIDSDTEIGAGSSFNFGGFNLDLQMDLGPFYLRYYFYSFSDQEFETELVQTGAGNQTFNFDGDRFRTSVSLSQLGYNFLDRYLLFIGLRKISVVRPLAEPASDLKGLDYELDAYGLGGGIQFEFKSRRKRLFNVYFPMGISAYYDLPWLVKTSTMQSHKLDDYEIISFGFMFNLGIGVYLNLKQSYFLELSSEINAQFTQISTSNGSSLISPNNPLGTRSSIFAEEEAFEQIYSAIYLKFGAVIDFHRYLHNDKSKPTHLVKYAEWKKAKQERRVTRKKSSAPKRK